MADSKPMFGLLTNSQVDSVQRFLIHTNIQGILMGIVGLLTVMVIYTLHSKGLRRSISRRILFIAALVLFSSSLTLCYSTLASDLRALTWLGAEPVPINAITRLSIGMVIGSRINYLFNDLIVVWRAWVLSDLIFYRTLLAAFSFILIGCEIAEGVLTIEGSFSNIQGNGKNKLLDLLLFVPLLATNILATCIIAHKTWRYRKEIKAHIQQKPRQTRVEKVLILLLESGTIYCILWIFILLTALGIFSDMATEVIASITPYTAAIYPMVIILLVSYGKVADPTTIGTVPTQSIHFASLASPNQRLSANVHRFSIIQSIANHIQHSRVNEEDTFTSSPTHGEDRRSKDSDLDYSSKA